MAEETDKERVVAFLKTHSGSNAKNIHGALSIPVLVVEGILFELRNEGKAFYVIERTKKALTQRWSLTDQ